MHRHRHVIRQGDEHDREHTPIKCTYTSVASGGADKENPSSRTGTSDSRGWQVRDVGTNTRQCICCARHYSRGGGAQGSESMVTYTLPIRRR